MSTIKKIRNQKLYDRYSFLLKQEKEENELRAQFLPVSYYYTMLSSEFFIAPKVVSNIINKMTRNDQGRK